MIAAVIRVLARDGAAGVTHRAVADEAGASHGSVRYYFATRDEMLAEALNTIVLEQAGEVTALLSQQAGASDEALVAAVARHLQNRVSHHRDSELARYELFLTAARTGKFQSTLDAWAQAYFEVFSQHARARGRSLSDPEMWRFLNLVNGILLRELATPTPGFVEEELVPALESFLLADKDFD